MSEFLGLTWGAIGLTLTGAVEVQIGPTVEFMSPP